MLRGGIVTIVIVTVDGMLGGHMVWVRMTRGRFVGGRYVKAPLAKPQILHAKKPLNNKIQKTETKQYEQKLGAR
jgi:hypothetical protein